MYRIVIPAWVFIIASCFISTDAHSQGSEEAVQRICFGFSFFPLGEFDVSYMGHHFKIIRTPDGSTIIRDAVFVTRLMRSDYLPIHHCRAKLAAAIHLMERALSEEYRAPPRHLGERRGTTAADIADTSTGLPAVIRTSRIFVGPHGVPPQDFAAYGIVAFPQKSTQQSYNRYVSACEAYIATLPDSGLLAAPIRDQMVTVWPIDDDNVVAELSGGNSLCKLAIDRFDLIASLAALKEARMQEDNSLSGVGPYLLAWSPAIHKGKKDALVLVADLSSAQTTAEFESYFREWRTKIEMNPELWRRGWSLADLQVAIRNWADKWGIAVLSIAQAKP